MLSVLKQRLASRSGFTLIELLAVIMVIAILLGMSLGAAQYVIKTARKNRAQVTAKALEVAITNYRHEYNKWPVPADLIGGKNKVVVSGDNNKRVFSALRQRVGNDADSDDTPGNTKHILFLDESTILTYLSSAKADKYGETRQGFVPLGAMSDDNTQYPVVYMDRRGQVQYYKVTVDFEDDTVSVTLPTI